jgi:hypothetical protein
MSFLDNPELLGMLLVGVTTASMLVALEVGRRLGLRDRKLDPKGERAGVSALEGVVFAVLGLMVAFTFSGSMGRFDARRSLVTQEANNVGTAWLRLDLLPQESQPALRELFRRYLDSRLAIYRVLPDVAAAKVHLATSQQLQGEIWGAAIAACEKPEGRQATMLLLPALNAMFDITTERTAATQHHTPTVIYALLAGLSIAAALLAGYGTAGNKNSHWTHKLAFVAVLSVVIYVIVDIEYPRLGLIRVDAIDQLLIDIREGMK